MPHDGETKPCTHPHCNGTMTYYSDARQVGKTGGGDDADTMDLENRRVPPAWYCNKDMAHDEPV